MNLLHVRHNTPAWTSGGFPPFSSPGKDCVHLFPRLVSLLLPFQLLPMKLKDCRYRRQRTLRFTVARAFAPSAHLHPSAVPHEMPWLPTFPANFNHSIGRPLPGRRVAVANMGAAAWAQSLSCTGCSGLQSFLFFVCDLLPWPASIVILTGPLHCSFNGGFPMRVHPLPSDCLRIGAPVVARLSTMQSSATGVVAPALVYLLLLLCPSWWFLTP
ncbi:hypothetical protein J5N97_002605 [Dioscorea zingiberensis]|uniref:Uncharacterized protein n=1 Tax=Dioscorea zingiberensis TaxID=325984 RepID=A0A9D5D486_9LILI|nr:hypothetical protein J5N97_002605 [Dioscorea zingiberensis]